MLSASRPFGVSPVCRAEPLRVLELRRDRVDRDDLRGPGDTRALDRRDTDPTGPEDDDGRPGLHLRGVERRTDSGRHPTTDESPDLIGHVVGDLHDTLHRDDHLLDEGPRPANPNAGSPPTVNRWDRRSGRRC